MFAEYIGGFQDIAEEDMTLRLRTYAPGGMTTDTDGYEVPGFTDKGCCSGKVQGSTAQGKDTQTRYVNIGGVERPVLEGGLHIPLHKFVSRTEGLLIKPSLQTDQAWVFVVEGVGGLADCALLGRRYQVIEVPAKSLATARRLTVVEVT